MSTAPSARRYSSAENSQFHTYFSLLRDENTFAPPALPVDRRECPRWIRLSTPQSKLFRKFHYWISLRAVGSPEFRMLPTTPDPIAAFSDLAAGCGSRWLHPSSERHPQDRPSDARPETSRSCRPVIRHCWLFVACP